jgi:hypothetical protein
VRRAPVLGGRARSCRRARRRRNTHLGDALCQLPFAFRRDRLIIVEESAPMRLRGRDRAASFAARPGGEEVATLPGRSPAHLRADWASRLRKSVYHPAARDRAPRELARELPVPPRQSRTRGALSQHSVLSYIAVCPMCHACTLIRARALNPALCLLDFRLETRRDALPVCRCIEARPSIRSSRAGLAAARRGLRSFTAASGALWAIIAVHPPKCVPLRASGGDHSTNQARGLSRYVGQVPPCSAPTPPRRMPSSAITASIVSLVGTWAAC